MTRALAAVALFALAAPASATNGAFRESAHGRRDTGVLRIPGLPRGECSHCHGAPRDALGHRAEGSGHAQLFALNDNALCARCHARTSASWLGDQRYDQSAHGSGAGAVWPGPRPRARDARDAGKCVNCHDPHGNKDSAGLIPDLLRVRGAALCLACHSGNPAPDVGSAFGKTYRHPLLTDAPAQPAAAGATVTVSLPPSNGAESGSCSACHNPHAAESGAGGSPMGASRPLSGVSRARVSNGAAGAPPVLTLTDESDPTQVREFELCFKCHSASAPRPARTGAVAAALNPANASFHPVQAQGRNRTIDRRAFAIGWGPERLVTCSDCHGTDDGLTRGPHGSSYPHILRARHETRSTDQPVLETDLCFSCHAHRTYADPFAGEAATYSRFASHPTHVARGYSCWWCHEAHGSVERPALVALRSPGIVAYVQDAGGGSCTTTCHVVSRPDATYRAPYPR